MYQGSSVSRVLSGEGVLPGCVVDDLQCGFCLDVEPVQHGNDRVVVATLTGDPTPLLNRATGSPQGTTE